MLPPTTGTTSNPTNTHPTANGLQAELQALYQDAHGPARTAAARLLRHCSDHPDHITAWVDEAADAAACEAVTQHLPAVVDRYLPGAQLVDRATTDPRVIDHTYTWGPTLVTITWDLDAPFGDPTGLTVTSHDRHGVIR